MLRTQPRPLVATPRQGLYAPRPDGRHSNPQVPGPRAGRCCSPPSGGEPCSPGDPRPTPCLCHHHRLTQHAGTKAPEFLMPGRGRPLRPPQGQARHHPDPEGSPPGPRVRMSVPTFPHRRFSVGHAA